MKVLRLFAVLLFLGCSLSENSSDENQSAESSSAYSSDYIALSSSLETELNSSSSGLPESKDPRYLTVFVNAARDSNWMADSMWESVCTSFVSNRIAVDSTELISLPPSAGWDSYVPRQEYDLLTGKAIPRPFYTTSRFGLPSWFFANEEGILRRGPRIFVAKVRVTPDFAGGEPWTLAEQDSGVPWQDSWGQPPDSNFDWVGPDRYSVQYLGEDGTTVDTACSIKPIAKSKIPQDTTTLHLIVNYKKHDFWEGECLQTRQIQYKRRYFFEVLSFNTESVKIRFSESFSQPLEDLDLSQAIAKKDTVECFLKNGLCIFRSGDTLAHDIWVSPLVVDFQAIHDISAKPIAPYSNNPDTLVFWQDSYGAQLKTPNSNDVAQFRWTGPAYEIYRAYNSGGNTGGSSVSCTMKPRVKPVYKTPDTLAVVVDYIQHSKWTDSCGSKKNTMNLVRTTLDSLYFLRNGQDTIHCVLSMQACFEKNGAPFTNTALLHKIPVDLDNNPQAIADLVHARKAVVWNEKSPTDSLRSSEEYLGLFTSFRWNPTSMIWMNYNAWIGEPLGGLYCQATVVE